MDKKTPVNWKGVQELYEQGASDVEVMRYLGLTKPQFYDYMSENAAFKHYVEMGRVLSEAWWMEQGRANLKPKQGERFDTTLYMFFTKNRFGWSEKLSTTVSNDKPSEAMSRDDLLAEIHKFMESYSKQFGTDPTMAQILKHGKPS